MGNVLNRSWSSVQGGAISVQYLKIEVRDGVHFLHADKPVAYPEGFRRRYTSLGAQTMCPNY